MRLRETMMAVTAWLLMLVISRPSLVESLKIMKQYNMTTNVIQTTNMAKVAAISKDPIAYSSAEEKLLEYLFKDYNPNIIPRESANESLKLYIGLAMVQLINIYDKEQVMKTNVWMHMWWNDPFLQWSHIEEFNHIISIRVPYDKVWTPDIILFNNALGNYDVSYKCNIVLYQQGGLLWIPPSIYKSSCFLDVKYFPLDQQICEMIFGSWVYNSDELTLDYFENMRNVDLNDYVPSGTWDIIDVPASIEYYTENATNKTKVHMIYRIKMRRKSLFYLVNIIIPTFLISFLTAFVFYLPTDDGEKITISLSTLFALVVFFLLISKIIPPTSIVVPLISKYLLFTFIMNILSVLNTCLVIGFYFKELHLEHMPAWFRFLFLKLLPTILFVRRKRKLNIFHSKELTKSVELYPKQEGTAEPSNGRLNPRLLTPPGSSPRNALPPMVGVHSPQSRPNSLFRSPSYACEETASLGYASPYSHMKQRSDAKMSRTKQSYSHHDLVVSQEMNGGKVATSTVRKVLMGNPGLFDNNEAIIEAYLKDKLAEKMVVGQNRRGRKTKGFLLNQTPVVKNSLYKTNQQQPVAPALPQPSPGMFEMRRRLKIPLSKLNEPADVDHSPKPKILKSTLKKAHSINMNEQKPIWSDETAARPKKKRLITFDTFRFSKRFSRLCHSVDYIASIYKDKAELNEIQGDWNYIALVFDRLMLIVFALVTVIGTVNCLFDAPHLFESVDEQNVIKLNSHRLGKP